MNISEKLIELGVHLPEVNRPAGKYVSYKRVDNTLYVAGQTTRIDGHIKYAGALGEELNLEEGKEAARICIENLLCQVKQACSGDLNQVQSVLKINVYIQSNTEFTGHAQVADAASDLLMDIFSEKGKHVRTSTGASSLPSNSAVEIDGVFLMRGI